jgi:hypothetical protein
MDETEHSKSKREPLHKRLGALLRRERRTCYWSVIVGVLLSSAAAICLLAMWKLRNGANHGPAGEPTPANLGVPADAKNGPESAGPARGGKTQSVTGIGGGIPADPSNAAIPTALVQVTNFIREIQRTVNGPVEIYGAVVDEQERPVEGAIIEFECVIYPDDYFSTNAVTGANGLFGLTGISGSKLTVRVAKPGYEYASETNRINIFTFSQLPAYERTRFRADSNAPAVFRLRRTSTDGR